MHRLLVVDDDDGVQNYVRLVAESLRYRVEAVGSAREVLDSLRSFDPDVVLLDLVMPQGDGVELLRSLSRVECSAPILLMSGMDQRTLRSAQQVGCELGLRMGGGLAKPFSPESLRRKLSGALSLHVPLAAEELRQALDQRALQLYLQPRVQVADGTAVGAEALLRWHHPDRGVLGPAQILPLAEQAGLRSCVTEWVLQAALEELRHFAERGLDLSLAVNLQASDLTDALPAILEARAAAAAVPLSRLVLEVTESEVMSTEPAIGAALVRLRMLGVEVSIDDFGTGFSSLRLLQSLPLSELKIDRSHVQEARHSTDAHVITRSVIDLGHALGLRVTAEGVEDLETWNLLQELGCDFLQGFVVGRPMPRIHFARWMQLN